MSFAQMSICLLISGFLSAVSQSQSPHSSTFKVFDRKPVSISEEEFEALRGRVMSRCHVASGTVPSKAPWYFHYELGLELEKRGDAQRALDALIEATNRHPESRRIARMYGMWFTDYRPYFEIAKMHFLLGNWQCAADALKISAGEQEVTEGDQDYPDFQRLQEATERHPQQH